MASLLACAALALAAPLASAIAASPSPLPGFFSTAASQRLAASGTTVQPGQSVAVRLFLDAPLGSTSYSFAALQAGLGASLRTYGSATAKVAWSVIADPSAGLNFPSADARATQLGPAQEVKVFNPPRLHSFSLPAFELRPRVAYWLVLSNTGRTPLYWAAPAGKQGTTGNRLVRSGALVRGAAGTAPGVTRWAFVGLQATNVAFIMRARAVPSPSVTPTMTSSPSSSVSPSATTSSSVSPSATTTSSVSPSATVSPTATVTPASLSVTPSATVSPTATRSVPVADCDGFAPSGYCLGSTSIGNKDSFFVCQNSCTGSFYYAAYNSVTQDCMCNYNNGCSIQDQMGNYKYKSCTKA